MKNLLLLLPLAALLSGCGLDGNTAKVADYSGITAAVGKGQEQVKKAIAVADDIAKNGTKAGSPEIAALQMSLKNSAADLQAALDAVAKSRDQNAANVKESNEAEGKLIAQTASLQKQLDHQFLWLLAAQVLACLTWQFEPLLKAPLSLYPPTAALASAVPDLVLKIILVGLEAFAFWLFFGVSTLFQWVWRLI